MTEYQRALEAVQPIYDKIAAHPQYAAHKKALTDYLAARPWDIHEVLPIALAFLDGADAERGRVAQAVQSELEHHRACLPAPAGVVHHSDQIIGFHLGLHWVQSLLRNESWDAVVSRFFTK